MDEEFSLDSTDTTERLVGWDCKISLIYIQREIFLMIHAMKREQEQERLYLKDGSSLQPLRQGISSIAQLYHSRERKNGLNLHPLKEHQKLEGKLNHRVD